MPFGEEAANALADIMIDGAVGPEATFVRRVQPSQSSDQTARQLPDSSTSIRVEPSSTRVTRRQGAQGDRIQITLFHWVMTKSVAPARRFQRGDVLGADQHLTPIALVTRHYPAFRRNIDPPT